MLKKLLSCLSLLLTLGVSRPVLAQRENSNWYFGVNAAISFPVSGPPVAVAGSAMSTYEACASVSDNTGQLLFYTNSENIWNRANQLMVNGTNLGGHTSATQGATIVQNPANAQQYYVFVLDYADNLLVGGLKYSLVDMTRQSGLGEAVLNRVQVSSVRLTERLTTVPHANGYDTWVIVHGWQTNTFYAYLLTAAGLQPNPVTTNIGAVHSGGGGANGNANSVGYLRASPDGRKLALGMRDLNFELFDFNAATGQLSNYVPLTQFYRSYGVAFSPDGRLLYGTNLDGLGVYQFDLQAGSAADIANSGLRIGSAANTVGAVQVGPDGKLYVSVVNSLYLAVIDNPNVRGVGCGFREYAVYLNGKTAQVGLPNYPSAQAPTPVTLTATFTGGPGCAGAAVAFVGTTQPALSGMVATWNFGDPASGSANTATGLTPTHTYAAAGTYQVTLTVTHPSQATPATSTQAITVAPLPQVQLGSNPTVCGTQLLLSAGTQPAGTTYRWQDGSTASTFLARASGTYQVTVTSAAGCSATSSTQVTLNSLPAPLLPRDTAVCTASVLLRPRNIPAGSTYRWPDGSTAPTFLARASGSYQVTIISAAGCVGTASTQVALNAVPTLRLPLDTTACATSVLLKPAAQPAGTTYRWPDGSTAATYLARASGSYQVTVTSAAGCASTATVRVTLNAVPAPRLPRDTVSCTASVLLRPGNVPAGSTYRWPDGSTAATYLARASGSYQVTVTSAAGCVGTASTQVALNVAPSPRLPADTAVCALPALLRPRGLPAGTTYRWQDGSTSATYLAQAAGTYSVQATTPQGCVGTATSRVQLSTVPVVQLGADTLVCLNAVWVLRPSPQPAGTLYRWQDGSTAPTYLARGPGQYTVEVRATAAGCPASATRLAVGINCPVVIPNIILPDGNTLNKFFTLKGLTPAEWHLRIFDRWGRQVYDQPRYDNGWNAAGQAPGIYYYLLRNASTGEHYQGWVEVMRGS